VDCVYQTVDGGEVAAWEDVSVEEIVEDFGGCMDLLLSILLSHILCDVNEIGGGER
jgi:hypothetical protein